MGPSLLMPRGVFSALTRVVVVLAVLLLFGTGVGPVRGQSAEQEGCGPGARSLFDGETLGAWEDSDFGFPGLVRVEDGTIRLGMSDFLTGVTWTGDFPRIDYEVTLEAKRILGGDFFCGLTFPVGDEPCTLIVGGWGGTLVGLSSIDGRDASENETRLVRGFENDRWYRIRLRVTEERIQAWIDDEPVADFEIAGHELSIRPEVRPSLPFGIASWQTTAALRKICVREL